MHGLEHNPALTVAIALAAGMIAQIIAQHLRIPGILLLLVAGVILGPEVAGIVHPAELGDGLHTIVGFSVAVILFEGGMSLDLRQIRSEGGPIFRLVIIAPIITVTLAMVAAHNIMDWGWRQSALFGSLVMVTGPTVVNPLLKRIHVKRGVATLLEAEGVMVDALGAIFAVVTLEYAMSTSTGDFSQDIIKLASRLGIGVSFGLISGLLLAGAMRVQRLIPRGLENVFILGQVLFTFHLSNAISPESGIAAVTAAGFLLGNIAHNTQKELREFKEQLTVMFIGMLFILLAADVSLNDVKDLGARGALVVVCLMFLIRPTSIFLSTVGTELSARQKAFIAWIGPRGIVAAAVASFFAVELDHAGISGGNELRALVFLVIFSTVVVAGLTGGLAARLLRVNRPVDHGWLILGSNEVATEIAIALQNSGQETICIDSNPSAVREARERGADVAAGNGIDEEFLEALDVETRRGVIGLTPNEEVNLIFCQLARQLGPVKNYLVSLRTKDEGVTPDMAARERVDILFGGCEDLRFWADHLHEKRASTETWQLVADAARSEEAVVSNADHGILCIPLVVFRGDDAQPVTNKTEFLSGDRVLWLVNHDVTDVAYNMLTTHGWQKGPA